MDQSNSIHLPILTIGSFESDGSPTGWVFDSGGIQTPQASHWVARGDDLIGGYTLAELHTIYEGARP